VSDGEGGDVGESDGEGKGEGESEGMALGVALAVAWAVSPDLTAISRPAATIVTTAIAQTTTTTILFPAVARAIRSLIRSITGSSLRDKGRPTGYRGSTNRVIWPLVGL
jgi:hypothetical protein